MYQNLNLIIINIKNLVHHLITRKEYFLAMTLFHSFYFYYLFYYRRYIAPQSIIHIAHQFLNTVSIKLLNLLN